jgi:hypothetical protein
MMKTKTYEEVVDRIAGRAFDAYLGGSNEPWFNAPAGETAWIYGVSGKKLDKDLDAAYERISKEWYARPLDKR